MDPDHWHIPPTLHLGALTGIEWGPDTLPGPRSHNDRIPQRRHWQTPEPAQPTGCWPANVVWADGPSPPLPTALDVWPVKTWTRLRQGRVMQASSDYILGADWCRFKMVGVRGIMNYPPDHLVLRSRILFSPTKAGHQWDEKGIPAQAGTVHRGIKETGR